jgi:thiol:disulfide interchange protein DsbD
MNMHRMSRLLSFVALVCVSTTATSAAVSVNHTTVELVAQNTALVRGDNTLALRIEPETGWHVYWRNPGDSGLPTELRFPELPAGVTAGELQWPYPHVHKLEQLTNYGYGENTLLPLTLTVADGAASPVLLNAHASWLVCADICIPGQADLALSLPIADSASADPTWQAAFTRAQAELPVPAPFTTVFAVVDGEFRLAASAIPGTATRAAFFPYAGDLVSHTAPARTQWSGRDLALAKPVSDYFVDPPATVSGVLVVGEGADAKPYEIEAQPGEIAAVVATPDATAATSSETPKAPEAPLGPGLGLALLLAFGGGLILNLMPCVFPVLSLKALSVMKAQDDEHSAHRRHALAYTAGVVASFVLVAAVLIALRSGGAALGWGFQLQSPIFVGLLVYVMVALGLSLSGVVQFGTRWMGAGQNLAARPGLSGSFFTGVLAVVVASPCTAPFMGTALGFALTQPAIASLSIFVALGLGLAAPFLLLGFVPALAARLPKPGAWMETLKQVLAFPMYLTAVWLLWVLGGLTDRNGMAVALMGVVALSFGLWLLGGLPRLTVKLLAYASIAGALALLFHPMIRTPTPSGAETTPVGWQRYSDARFEELRAQGKTVFVDFTADWCLTCKVNERVALRTSTVEQAFAQHEVTALLADWTRADPEITAALARYQRSGVPLYLVSVKGGEPRVLPQVLSAELVAEAVAGN